MLTKGLGRSELQRSDVGGESGGEARRCARDQVVALSLRACWCVEEVRAGTAKVYRGSDRLKAQRRRENRGGGPTYPRRRQAQIRPLQVM